MKDLPGRFLLVLLSAEVLLPSFLSAQEKLGKDPRLAPVSVPFPPEIQASLDRTRDLAARGRIQGAVTLLAKLARTEPSRLFPAAPGWFLPFPQALDRFLPAMGKDLVQAWRERVRTRAGRLLEEGLAGRKEELLRKAADLFPATRARREALLALADLALEGSRLWKALYFLEEASQGASPGEKARILVRQAFAWARLGKKGARDEALAELAALGRPVPLEGKKVDPSGLAKLPPFQVAPPGRTPVAWLPGSGARLWARAVSPPPQVKAKDNLFVFFSFRGGNFLQPGPSGPLEKLDTWTSWILFGRDCLFLRSREGVDILETATGRLVSLLRKGSSSPKADPAMPSPTLPSWAMAERRPARMGDLLFLQVPSKNATSSRTPHFRVPGEMFAPGEKTVSAFRLSTGKPAWTLDRSSLPRALSRGTILSGPVAGGGTVAVLFLASRNFYLLGLDAETGSFRWAASLHGGGTGYLRPPLPPLLAEKGTFFVPTGAGAVCAVDARSGRVLWLQAYPRKDPSAPLLHPLTESGAGWMASSGGAPPPGFQVSPPLLLGKVLVLAPPDSDYVLGISPLDGRLLWTSSRRDPRIPGESPPLVDHLVGGDEERIYLAGRKLLALETRTGRRIWEAEIPPVTGRGAVTANSILLPTRSGVLAVGRSHPHSTVYLGLPGRPPGPMDLYPEGPFLAGVTKDHVVLWAQWKDWTARAPGPAEKARRLALCGRLDLALQAAPPGMKASLGPAWSLDLARLLLEEGKGRKGEALQVLARAEREARNPLDRVALLYLHYQVLHVSGKEAQADRIFLEFLQAALEATREETR